jgi:hypothetical protein
LALAQQPQHDSELQVAAYLHAALVRYQYGQRCQHGQQCQYGRRSVQTSAFGLQGAAEGLCEAVNGARRCAVLSHALLQALCWLCQSGGAVQVL